MAVQQLTERLLPKDISKEIIFKQLDSPGKDRFELSTTNGKILIKGNTQVAMASGLNWYLKYYCNSTVSWSGNQLNVPTPLPKIEGVVSKSSNYEHSYYLNYCTYNYSMSFWDWDRWQQEIDWMALNGINLPLSIVGTEMVWTNVLKELNFTTEEIDNFIPGPAFTGWWLMTNLEGWGGKVSKEYMQQQVNLQKKILKRMRSYGMKPVLPGFFGMVPNALKDKFPTADIRDQGLWAGGFKRPAFLSPTDSLFTKIAKIFYREQKKLYGVNEYFSGDPFHEGGNPHGIDLPTAGKNLISSIKEINPEAKWVFQAWGANPRSKMLTKIKNEDLLILDLDADNRPQWENKKAWGGKNWIWSTITNFGGNVGMFGRLDVINKEIVRASKTYPHCLKGIGVMPEGIENNPILYEFLYEFKWRNSSVDLNSWVSDYAHRRYGAPNNNINAAWQILEKTVYGKKLHKNSSQQGTNESIFCARPLLNIERVSTWGTSKIHYNPKKLLPAWRLFIKESNKFKDALNFQYDLVDITRQVLANYAQVIHANMIKAYKNNNLKAFNRASEDFISLIKDQNTLLNSKKEFMLGPWLESAKKLSTNPTEEKLFEYNARVQITTWSFQNSNLHEYSHREWGGMLQDFYLPRWNMFIKNLKLKINGKKTSKIDFYKFEDNWNKKQNSFPTEEQGNCIDISKDLYKKYYNKIINA